MNRIRVVLTWWKIRRHVCFFISFSNNRSAIATLLLGNGMYHGKLWMYLDTFTMYHGTLKSTIIYFRMDYSNSEVKLMFVSITCKNSEFEISDWKKTYIILIFLLSSKAKFFRILYIYAYDKKVIFEFIEDLLHIAYITIQIIFITFTQYIYICNKIYHIHLRITFI